MSNLALMLGKLRSIRARFPTGSALGTLRSNTKLEETGDELR